jgi:NtrC-family two-component system response regulator AlgB
MVRVASSAWSALVVDDDPGVRQSLRLCLEAGDGKVLGVGTPSGALEALERGRFDLVFLDLWLGPESGLALLPEILRRQPDAAVIVITAFATFESAVTAMRTGAMDYLPKPFSPDQVRHAANRVLEALALKRQVSELRERLGEMDVEGTFDSESPTFRSFLQTAGRAAASDAVVLLRGESGTGKNVLARWIRAQSPRAERPFVAVNCPALSGDLMSSTLFGHKRGAFTGAVADAIGKVEEAERGTLFLDEVGDLVPDTQARLLRFLNDRSYERLGEARERKADVRLVAATNRALEEEVRAGRFREDLLFRLNVVTLTLPPLRDRREDILPLARNYLRFFGAARGGVPFVFSPATEAALVSHSWPGNLRELRNAVERATILAPAPVIDPVDLGIPASPPELSARAKGAAIVLGEDVTLEDLEREHLARVLARVSSSEAAAKILGIDATTVQRKRKRYGLA